MKTKSSKANPQPPSSLLADQLRLCRRKQWLLNKTRLKIWIGNLLKLGLGENLWYGYRLHGNINEVSSVGHHALNNVNVEHAVDTVAHPDEVVAARNQIQKRPAGEFRVFGRYKVTIE